MIRLLPMGSSAFVTFVGSKVSNMVRVGSVFWASSAPILIPSLQEMRRTGNFTVDNFMAIGSAVYAGGMGAFVATKRKGFGIMVQGVTLGYIVSDMIKGFAMAELLRVWPGAADFMEWIEMIFTFAIGVSIGQYAKAHEDLISIAATAAMGAYVQMQVVVSMGFEFSKGLSVEAAMDGQFGCDNNGCYALLGFTLLYGLAGTYNQFKMMSVMRKMADPDANWEPSGRYDRLMAKFNMAFGALFELNNIIKQEGAVLTQEEIDELAEKKKVILEKLATVGSDAAMVFMTFSVFAGVVEGFARGCFDTGMLAQFALLLLFIGTFTVAMAAYLIRTHIKFRAPEQEGAKRRRLGIYLVLAAFLIPLCALSILLILLSGAAGETPLEIAYVRNYFDINKQSPEAQACLVDHMPTVTATLSNLLTAMLVSWVCVCRYMGGAPYVAARLTSMVSWLMLLVGAIVGLSGMGMSKTDDNQLEMEQTPMGDAKVIYDLLVVVGVFLVISAVLGILGVKFTVKGGVRAKLGRLLLLGFRVMVIILCLVKSVVLGVAVWYYRQMDTRIDSDWERIQEKYTDSMNLMQEKLGFSTKDEFVDFVNTSFRIIIVAGGVVLFLLTIGFIGAHYLARSGKKVKDVEVKDVPSDDESDGDNDDGGGGGGGKKKKKSKKKKKKTRGIGAADESELGEHENPLKDDAGGDVPEVDPEEDKLRALWDVMDADASGTLNQDETKRIMVAMGQKMDEKKFAKAFKKIDPDGSGEVEFD
eukprot:SAG31_NODE_4686_length_3032_cov_1.744630_1_plen_755_part_10